MKKLVQVSFSLTYGGYSTKELVILKETEKMIYYTGGYGSQVKKAALGFVGYGSAVCYEDQVKDVVRNHYTREAARLRGEIERRQQALAIAEKSLKELDEK